MTLIPEPGTEKGKTRQALYLGVLVRKLSKMSDQEFQDAIKAQHQYAQWVEKNFHDATFAKELESVRERQAFISELNKRIAEISGVSAEQTVAHAAPGQRATLVPKTEAPKPAAPEQKPAAPQPAPAPSAAPPASTPVHALTPASTPVHALTPASTHKSTPATVDPKATAKRQSIFLGVLKRRLEKADDATFPNEVGKHVSWLAKTAKDEVFAQQFAQYKTRADFIAALDKKANELNAIATGRASAPAPEQKSALKALFKKRLHDFATIKGGTQAEEASEKTGTKPNVTATRPEKMLSSDKRRENTGE